MWPVISGPAIVTSRTLPASASVSSWLKVISLDRRLLPRALEQGHQRQNEQEDDHPEGEISIIRVHRLPVAERPREISRILPTLSFPSI